MSAALDDPRAELLSALLDGELDADEERDVRAWLEQSGDARAELDELARVRSLVRDLPVVDPPFGFFERMGRPSRARTRGTARVARRPAFGAAIAAAAAAVVLLVGLTPVADAIVPPVNQYADRHMRFVAASASAPAPAFAGPGDEYEAMSDSEVDAMDAPYAAPTQLGPGYGRTAAYHAPSEVVHLMYTKGSAMVSVYAQPGAVAWGSMPAAGSKMMVEDEPAWMMAADGEEVIVVERAPIVYTVVAVGQHDEMLDVVRDLPDPPDPGFGDRVQQACRAVVDRFSPF